MLLSAPLIDRDKPWSKISKDLAGADRQGRKRPPLLPNFFPFDFCANAPKTHTRAHTAHTHPPQFNPKLNGSLRALRRTHPRNEFQTRQFPLRARRYPLRTLAEVLFFTRLLLVVSERVLQNFDASCRDGHACAPHASGRWFDPRCGHFSFCFCLFS